MRASLLKILRKRDGRETPGALNYKTFTFLVCLIISMFLWLMNSFSQKFTDSLTFTIKINRLSAGRKLMASPDTLRIKMLTSGFRLLGYKLGFFDRDISIEAGQLNRKENQFVYSIGSHNHFEKVEEQLGEEVKVLDIMPDTIYLSYLAPNQQKHI